MLIVEIAERELSDRQLEVWYHMRIEGMDARSVASDLRIAEPTVFLHLWNAENRLAHCLDEVDPEEEYIRTQVVLKAGSDVWEQKDTTLAGAINRIKRRLTKKKREEERKNI